MFDYHMHTNVSYDGRMTAMQAVDTAVKVGLKEICFTDHLDYDPLNPESKLQYELEKYSAAYDYLTHKDLKIRRGMEFGMLLDNQEMLLKKTSERHYDFVIGSAHVCDKADPYFPEYWKDKTEYEGTYRYFEYILECINVFDDFDVFGHVDYIVRYGPTKAENYSYQKYQEILNEILKTLISKNIGLELNTAGLKYGLGFAHPHMDILKKYREFGGEIITVGSDGHKPEHLAYDFHKVPSILKEAGFHYYTIFKNRKPEFIKL